MCRRYLRLYLGMIALLIVPGLAPAADECLIAVIKSKNQPRHELIHQAFAEQIADADCRIYVQSPNPDYMSFRNSARKAVAIGADIIVAYGTTAALAVETETHNAQILFADVYDPAAQKLVSDRGMPLQHATGIRGDAPIQTLFKAYLGTTGAKRLGVLFDPYDPAGKYQTAALQEVGDRKGVAVIPLPLAHGQGLSDVLDRLDKEPVDLFLTDSDSLVPLLPEIYRYAHDYRVAVISQSHGAAERGCLMSLETDPVEQGTTLAELAKQVVDGRETDEIQMVSPKKVSLTVNLRVAEYLGLKVPFDVLSMTTKVIR